VGRGRETDPVREVLLRKYGFESPIKVLDHGHVFLVDVMGDDRRVESSARLSYTTSETEETRTPAQMRRLIRYLMRHRHTSPFEQCVITLNMKMPIFVARQFVRHRTQAINEISGRYTKLPDEFFVPEQVFLQSTVNHQGRGDMEVSESEALTRQMRDEAEELFKSYGQYLDAGMAKELARINLPLSTYTEWQTTMNLHNMLHLLRLRMDSHAQAEARAYADAIAKIVADWVPVTWEAFEEYHLHAVTFSRTEMEIIRGMMREQNVPLTDHLLAAGEKVEFMKKLGW
jgi:thymidylate synthase (FAD)